MKKTFKVVAMLLFVLVTSTFVFAQTSSTYTGTAGTLRDDADNFMDVRYYNEVDFSNFFVMTSLSLNKANLGFAKKFDNLYLGTYYNGTLWDGGSSTKTTTEDSVSSTKNFEGTHEFDLLVGFDNMALKLDTTFDFNDTYTAQDKDTKETEKDSISSFYLTWGGLSIPVEKGNFKPWTRIGLYLSDKTEKTVQTSGDSTYTLTDKSGNLNLLSITLASDFESGDKDSFFSVAGLAYSFNTAVGANGIIAKATDGTDTETMERADYVYILNYIDPYYRFEYKVSDKFKFGGKVSAFATISSSYAGYTYPSDNKPEADAIPKLPKTTITEIESSLGFGMQYKLKPNFAINAGLYAVLPTFESTKTVTPVGDSTSITVESEVSSSFSSTLYTGFVLDINENCALDAYMNIGRTPSFLNSVLGGSLSLGFKYKM